MPFFDPIIQLLRIYPKEMTIKDIYKLLNYNDAHISIICIAKAKYNLNTPQ